MTELDFSIRPARQEDSALLLGLIRELAVYEKLENEVTATLNDLNQSIFADSSTVEALLGEYQGKAIAFAVYYQSYSTFVGKPGLYLEDLYVRPEYRGRGYGKAMMVHLARLAVEKGYARFEWTALDWNESAIGFYGKLGAETLDQWKTFRLSGEKLKALSNAGRFSSAKKNS